MTNEGMILGHYYFEILGGNDFMTNEGMKINQYSAILHSTLILHSLHVNSRSCVDFYNFSVVDE